MKSVWSEILVPAVIVGATLAQTLGVEAYRAGERAEVFAGKRSEAVESQCTGASAGYRAESPRDTIMTGDSGYTADDDFLFGEFMPEDTMPKITARDTMKVPDSLKTTDPFLYQWYVAVKDSLTHRIVVDSLREAGDSIMWPVIDSLYLADSTRIAKEKFDLWWAGLTKAERKRWEYEQKLPAILHKQDSILHRKDSLKHRRDSIIQNTPRILETPYLPDSLYYQRLVVWKHNQEFNEMEIFPWDTTFNYHFEDYPYMREDLGGSFLGVAGSAVQTYNFFKRDEGRSSVSFYRPIESWTYSPESIPMFNTKTPYTELEYNGTQFATASKESDNIRLFTTQNILPALNIALEFKRYGGEGILQHEKTINKTSYVAGNWLGKRYLAHFGFIHNASTREENGGLTDLTMIRDTTVEVREISVVLSDAANKYKKNTLFLDQTLRIPFTFIERIKHRGDSTYVPTGEDVTTAFIGSSHEYTVWSKYYTDAVSSSNATGNAFYGGHYYINPSKSADSLRMAQLDNKVFIRLQPWKEDFFISRVEGGLGDRFRSHYMMQPGDYLRASASSNWNTVYAYAGAEGRINRYFQWDALGQFDFAGTEAGDFTINANGKLSLFPFRRHPNSPLSLTARFEQTLLEPDYFQQNFFSNHYRWSNDFSKISTTKLEAQLDIPRWRLQASASYGLLAGNIWYDTNGIAQQNTTPMSVASVYLRKDFVFASDLVHLENRFLLQYSSDQSVVPLPLLAANLRYYIQFPIVSADVMKMQIGVNTHYNTAWYAPAYNPVAGVFMNQDTYQYGNCPRFDAFVNMQWKTACVFLKFENVGQGWPMERHDYFSAANYIHTTRSFKIGIYWPFHPPLSGVNRTLSDRAGSGMGGDSGGGLGGGLGGALGGLRGGNR
jgi:hypothetical protein